MRISPHCLTLSSIAFVLTGCAYLPFTDSSPKAAPAARALERCNSQDAQWAVGKTNTEQHVNEARRRAGAYMVRVLRPGQITTREFNEERLNLEVDATGRILAARCG